MSDPAGPPDDSLPVPFATGPAHVGDIAAIATDVLRLMSGAEFTAAVGDLFADEPDVSLTVDLGESAADELAELPWWDEFADALAAELGDALTIDGGTLALGEDSGDGGTLAENERFAAAFADAPGEASVASSSTSRLLSTMRRTTWSGWSRWRR